MKPRGSVCRFEEGIGDVLLLLHKLLTLLETVALALDVDDRAMMQDAVKYGGSDGDVGEDVIPLGEGLVRGKNSGDLLVTPSDELKEQVGALNVHREVADLVDDEELVLAEDLELVGEPVLKMSPFELFNELMAVDVIGGLSMTGGDHAQSRGEMGLADARRAEEYDVLAGSVTQIL